jgi:hypothetical protein
MRWVWSFASFLLGSPKVIAPKTIFMLGFPFAMAENANESWLYLMNFTEVRWNWLFLSSRLRANEVCSALKHEQTLRCLPVNSTQPYRRLNPTQHECYASGQARRDRSKHERRTAIISNLSTYPLEVWKMTSIRKWRYRSEGGDDSGFMRIDDYLWTLHETRQRSVKPRVRMRDRISPIF